MTKDVIISFENVLSFLESYVICMIDTLKIIEYHTKLMFTYNEKNSDLIIISILLEIIISKCI